ncbi:MAG: DivIVA domain-containing protein [Clostridia bacterium]|nr:DivIVA domain-containing protein [Clostridia bacterium]
MITPLDIENKKFSKQVLNGYSVEEVDDFLDELTAEYEKIYKEATENRGRTEKLSNDLNRYQSIESTLQNTLLMAQTTADEVKKTAQKQADAIIAEAQIKAKEALKNVEGEIILKQKELDDLQKQFDIYKAKMESLLISQLELLKESAKDNN